MTLLQALETVSSREDIRTQESYQDDIIRKQTEPRKFKDNRKWNDWDKGIIYYLSNILGALRVSLSYVIRENVDPILEGHDNFIEKSIACAPLAGPIFEADARRVNQVINSNVQCKAAEQWIEPNKNEQNERIDMLTLIYQYYDEVN